MRESNYIKAQYVKDKSVAGNKSTVRNTFKTFPHINITRAYLKFINIYIFKGNKNDLFRNNIQENYKIIKDQKINKNISNKLLDLNPKLKLLFTVQGLSLKRQPAASIHQEQTLPHSKFNQKNVGSKKQEHLQHKNGSKINLSDSKNDRYKLNTGSGKKRAEGMQDLIEANATRNQYLPAAAQLRASPGDKSQSLIAQNGNFMHNSNSVYNGVHTEIVEQPTLIELECIAGYDGGLPQYFFLEAYDSRTKKLRLNITSALNDIPLFRIDLAGK